MNASTPSTPVDPAILLDQANRLKKARGWSFERAWEYLRNRSEADVIADIEASDKEAAFWARIGAPCVGSQPIPGWEGKVKEKFLRLLKDLVAQGNTTTAAFAKIRRQNPDLLDAYITLSNAKTAKR